MHRRHQMLLSKNYEFLVMEIPMDLTLEAMKKRKVLTWHDFEQLKTLRHQGRRALARYLLAVLPARGPRAFQALLESLQEANAQHLVDLLVAQADVSSVEQLVKTPPPGMRAGSAGAPPRSPSDTPLPPGPDPHEYAVRLARNNKLIREFVDPSSISPVLAQNKIITAREGDMVLHLHGKNKKWDLILSALLQRGERAYQAFMAALLQKGYSTMFHTIQETSTAPSEAEEDVDGVDCDEDEDEDENSLYADDIISKTSSKATQVPPRRPVRVTSLRDEEVEESEEEVREEAKASANWRNRRGVDAESQTLDQKPKGASPQASGDSRNRRSASVASHGQNGRPNGGGHNSVSHSPAHPTATTSGDGRGGADPPDRQQENGSAVPNGGHAGVNNAYNEQRKRSSVGSNLKSLREEDEIV